MKGKTINNYRGECHKNRGVHPMERALQKIRKEPSGCWTWLGCGDKDGYGFIRIDGKNIRAHRFMAEAVMEDSIVGKLICHKCDTPRCVNPAHMFAGTNSDNQKDAARKKRHPGWRGLRYIGEKHLKAKLTDADVLYARQAAKLGVGISELARKFHVSSSTMQSAVSGKNWKHLNV